MIEYYTLMHKGGQEEYEDNINVGTDLIMDKMFSSDKNIIFTYRSFLYNKNSNNPLRRLET